MHGPEAACSMQIPSKAHECKLQELKGCWPIKDTRQQKEYRKVSMDCSRRHAQGELQVQQSFMWPDLSRLVCLMPRLSSSCSVS